jgi:hypothetical protein
VSMKEDMTRDIEVHNTIVGDEGTERTLHLPLDVEDRQEVNHDVVDMRHEVDRLDGVVVVDSRGIVLDRKGGRDRVIDRKGFRRRRLGVYRGPLMQDRCLPCFQTSVRGKQTYQILDNHACSRMNALKDTLD